MPTSITRTDLRLEMEGPEPPVLVEALGAAYFADAHLPGAINIPPGQVDRLAPSSSETSMRASSCTPPAGATAPAWSLVSSRVLHYSDVRVYEGGKEHWGRTRPSDRPTSEGCLSSQPGDSPTSLRHTK